MCPQNHKFMYDLSRTLTNANKDRKDLIMCPTFLKMLKYDHILQYFIHIVQNSRDILSVLFTPIFMLLCLFTFFLSFSLSLLFPASESIT